MNLFPANKKVQFGYVVFCTLVSINLWSFQKVDDKIFKLLEAVVIASLTLIVAANAHVFFKKGMRFRANVHLFLWVPLLCVIGANLYHGQAPWLTLFLLRSSLYWMLYFVLHLFEIPPKKILKLLIFVGCVWALLTVVQQFTYPTAFFYTRDDDDHNTILRAGVYRYMLSGQQYGVFLLLFFFYRFLELTDNRRMRAIPYILLGLAGFYYFGTRQFAATIVVCMAIGVLYLKASARAKYIILAMPTVLLLWVFKDVFFGQYIELTNHQMQYGYEGNIRMLCGDFYLNDYWPHWTAKFFGNGPSHYSSDYGKEMRLILDYFHFFRSDVGLIGSYNKFGIFYVFAVLGTCLKGMFYKFDDRKDLYLKLFFFNSFLLLLTNETFSSERVIPYYCFIFYLIDCSFKRQAQTADVAEQQLEMVG